MLGRGDITRYSYSILLPDTSLAKSVVDEIGKITLKELKTDYFGRAGALLRAFSEGIPWLIFQKDTCQMLMGSKDIRLELRFRPGEGDISISTDEERPRRLEWSDLAKIEKDANYVIGLLLGKLAVAPQMLKIEETLEIRKEKLFTKGFSDHFNQAFLASLGIKEVTRIDVVMDEESKGKKEEVVYSLAKGDKSDLVVMKIKSDGFAPLTLEELLSERVTRANTTLEKVGVTN
jgi:hypothetical protein